ncbi:hypothetical protein BH23CHL2_BH23CHL2_35970 [soil metagenome]
MSGEERFGQRREIFGSDTSRCDLCGTVVPSSELREIESTSPLADHDHVNMICSACTDRVLQGEIDIESFLIDDDEYPDRNPGQW